MLQNIKKLPAGIYVWLKKRGDILPLLVCRQKKEIITSTQINKKSTFKFSSFTEICGTILFFCPTVLFWYVLPGYVLFGAVVLLVLIVLTRDRLEHVELWLFGHHECNTTAAAFLSLLSVSTQTGYGVSSLGTAQCAKQFYMLGDKCNLMPRDKLRTYTQDIHSGHTPAWFTKHKPTRSRDQNVRCWCWLARVELKTYLGGGGGEKKKNNTYFC